MNLNVRNAAVRPVKRIKPILETIEQAWVKNPDFRLGQLLTNVTGQLDLFYTDDYELVELLKKEYLTDAKNKRSKT